jgi:hypothetical protein
LGPPKNGDLAARALSKVRAPRARVRRKTKLSEQLWWLTAKLAPGPLGPRGDGVRPDERECQARDDSSTNLAT